MVRAEEKVVDDRAFVGDEHFLKDCRDAERPRLMRRGRRVAEDGDLAGVDRQNTRDNLGERALA